MAEGERTLLKNLPLRVIVITERVRMRVITTLRDSMNWREREMERIRERGSGEEREEREKEFEIFKNI